MIYGWNFIKSVDFASKYHWPVIAPARYFDYEKLVALNPTLLNENVMDVYDYEKPSVSKFKDIIQIPIPVEIENAFISSYPSCTNAYLHSVVDDWPNLQDFLYNAIKHAELETASKAEAIMSLVDHKFIRNTAKRLGIATIFYEWSSVRKPSYDRRIYYMDFSGLQQNSQLEQRYEIFKNEQNQCVTLTRKELLAIFLRKEDLGVLDDAQYLAEPIYELGVALPGTEIMYVAAHNMAHKNDLYIHAYENFSPDEIYFRFHPGTESKAIPKAINIDNDGRVIDFIMRSKRVLCSSSNIAFEAALFNRPCYDIGWTQYQIITNRTLKNLHDDVPSNEMLSYIAFGFFVPSELLWQPDYLRLRLQMPSESEIYKYHLSYYLNTLSLDEKILNTQPAKRLETIIASRLEHNYETLCSQINAPIWAHKDERTRNEIRCLRMQRAIDRLLRELSETKAELQNALGRAAAIEASRAYRLASFPSRVLWPEGTRRRLAYLLAKKTLRHPLVMLKHLITKN